MFSGQDVPVAFQLPTHPTLKHPKTGESLVAAGVLPSGKIVWPVMGASPDDPDDDDTGGDDGDKGGKDDKDDSGDSGSGDDDDDDDDSSGDDKDTVSKADHDSALKRMKAADKRASDAERKLKAQEDAKKDELTRAQDRVTELETSNTELQTQLTDLRLNNAFLTANTHNWHDQSAALSIARSEGYIKLDDIVDEDTGEIDKKSLKRGLDKLASEKAYLVKTSADESGGGSSGSSASGRSGNGKDDKAAKQQRHQRFGALASRARAVR